MIHRDLENEKDLFIETLTSSHRSAAKLKGDTERERTKREEKKRGR